MQNEAQYALDRKTAEISALASNDLDKYEHLTGENLGLKPSTVEQAKIDYSPLREIFTKGLDKNKYKKEELFKRLKDIKSKNEEQLKAIEDQAKKKLDAIKNINTGTNSLKTISYFSQLSAKAKELSERFKKEKNNIDPEKLVCVRKDGEAIFGFNIFKIHWIWLRIFRVTRNYLKMRKANNTT